MSVSSSSGQPANGARPFWRWLALALLVVVLDQLSKQWILQHYRWGEFTPVTQFFNIVRAHNTGAAFSFLAGQGGWQRWFFVAIAALAALFILWQLRVQGQQRLASAALALILGGAIGNVIDRIAHGYVVDFLDFHWRGAHFPAFNVADMAITLGVVGVLLAELLRWRQERVAH